MPRPKRGRPAPARAAKAAPPRSPSAEPVSDNDGIHGEQEEIRGRSRRTRPAGRLSVGEQDAIRAANRNRDTALDRLANEDATSSNTGRDEDSGSSVEVGRRAMATPAHRRDTTGLDLGDSVFGDLDDSFEDGDVPDGSRSVDVSSMSFSTFRPRSRQSSFIGRNDPPIRPSSRGGTTPGVSSSFNIGVFTRRAREPSILGTNRKPLQGPSRTVQEPESESEDEFEPEAESTPLNNRRRTQQSKEVERQSSPEIPGPSNTKKRKSEDAHHSNIRPEKLSRTEPIEQPVEGSDSSELSDLPPSPQQLDEESDSELSELSSPQEPPGLFQRPVTPINEDEIMAPPASSGSEGPDIWPDIRTLAKRRRRPSITTPTRLDNLSDISSPPSLTHSPNFEEARAARTRGRPVSRQQHSPKLTTADLTSLLPKRRYKKARDPLGLDSDEELDTTGLGNDDDELSYLDTRAARRRKGSRPPSRATSARPASRGGRAGNSTLKPKQAPVSARASSRNARSYSHHSSDKENDGDDGNEESDDENEDGEGESRFIPLADDTFDTGSAQTGETLSADELKQAARKFREVDRWELDYEEVTETSSPQDGR